MRRGNGMSGGRSFAGRPTGQQYDAFHSALLSKCYPKCGDVSTSGAPVVVKTPQGNRTAGFIQTINGNPVFVKRVEVCKHLQRNMDAWGFDVRVLDTLRERNVCRIRVISDDGDIYDVFTNIIGNHSVRRSFGHGEQCFLSRKYWYRGEWGKFGGSGVTYGE